MKMKMERRVKMFVKEEKRKDENDSKGKKMKDLGKVGKPGR